MIGTRIKVDVHLGYDIHMAGFNHFECKELKLYGYSTVQQVKNAIARKTGNRPKNACHMYSI